jgi:hypothetical protein
MLKHCIISRYHTVQDDGTSGRDEVEFVKSKIEYQTWNERYALVQNKLRQTSRLDDLGWFRKPSGLERALTVPGHLHNTLITCKSLRNTGNKCMRAGVSRTSSRSEAEAQTMLRPISLDHSTSIL